MKNLILLALILLPTLAFAQKLPWPEGLPCAQIKGLDPDNRFVSPISARALMGNTFKEIEEMIAIMQGKPKVEISFEYLQYRYGYQVIASAKYYPDCKTFDQYDEEELRFLQMSHEKTLTKKDFKGPKWIHMVQAIDTEEANCLAISKVNGVLGGCNDLWQDGIAEEEAVCIKGQTHLKCHINCLEKIYNREIEKTPGFCQEQE